MGELTPWMLQQTRDYHTQPIPDGPANAIALEGVGLWVGAVREHDHRLEAAWNGPQPVTGGESQSAVRPG